MKKDIVALGIVALLIGVATTPAISTTRIQSNSNHHTLHQKPVEINIQLCGITEQENNTLELSETEAQKLAHLMNNIQKTFENATTDDEILTVFHNAIVTLKQHNLLPSGMSVRQAEQLITSRYVNQHSIGRIFPKPNNKENLPNHNFLCLIAGKTDSTFFQGIAGTELALSYSLLVLCKMLLGIDFDLDDRLLSAVVGFLFLSDSINPAWVGSMVGIGQWGIYGRTYPAHGWIHTFGLLGQKSWNGSVTGRFPFPVFFCPVGVIGFTGIKITLDAYGLEKFYLGSALWVNIT